MILNKLTAAMLVAGLTLMLIPAVSANQKAKKSAEKIIVLSKDNTLVLSTEVTGQEIGRLLTEAKLLDKKTSFSSILRGKDDLRPIHLYLNTPGGEIQSGLEGLEELRGLRRPVDTITSFAASMGFQFVQNLGKRYILKSGVLMSHRAQGQFSGFFGGKHPSQVDSRMQLWLDRVNEMDQQTVDRTEGKQTLKSYQEAYDPELWVTGAKAVEQGYADELVTVRCDESLDGVTTHTVMLMGIIPVDYDLDNCPLNSSPMNIRIHVETNKGVKLLSDFQKEGGGFGTVCLNAAVFNSNILCAVDPTLSIDRITQSVGDFKERMKNKKDHVVPMVIPTN